MSAGFPVSGERRTLAGVTRSYISAGHRLDFGGVTHVMGVINLSPESKNRDTFASDADTALARAEAYRRAGATIIDVGAQSSVRGNVDLPPGEEIDRLAGPVAALVAEGHLVSVDTWKPEVARAGVELGAALVNDTGGLADPDMIALVAESGVVAVSMYLEGETPLDVDTVTISDTAIDVMAASLGRRLATLEQHGVTQVLVDPGIGITYTSDYEAYTRQQLRVVRGLGTLGALGRPVLIPIPRKAEPHRVMAFIALALEYGADVIRVHDVEAACDLVRFFDRAPR